MRTDLLNLVLSFVGIVGLLVGVVLLISPIPVGLILITLSLSLLVVVNKKARRVLKKLRSRYLWINARMLQLEAKLENKFVTLWHVFTHTRPDVKKSKKRAGED